MSQKIKSLFMHFWLGLQVSLEDLAHCCFCTLPDIRTILIVRRLVGKQFHIDEAVVLASDGCDDRGNALAAERVPVAFECEETTTRGGKEFDDVRDGEVGYARS